MFTDETVVPVAPVRSLPTPGAYVCGLTWDGTHLWHSDQEAKAIWAIDPADGRVVRSHDCGWVRADMAFDGEHLWQIGGRPKRVLVVDRDDGAVLGQREMPPSDGGVTGIEVAADGVWTCRRDPVVVQLRDPATLVVCHEFPAAAVSPSGLTRLGDVVVYGDFDTGVLRAVDAGTGRHRGAAQLVGRATGLTWDGSLLWYCDFPSRSLCAIDPAAFVTA